MWWRHKCESATKSSLRSLQDSWNPTPASCLCLFVFLFFKGLLWGLGAASPPLQETYGTDLLVGQASFCHVSDTENAQNFTALPSPYPLSLIILVRLLLVLDICCTVIRTAPHFTWSASAFIHILSDFIIKRPPRRTLMLTWLLLKGFIYPAHRRLFKQTKASLGVWNQLSALLFASFMLSKWVN